MGALTDHRKRCFADLRLPPSPPSPLSPPPTKKPRLPLPPPCSSSKSAESPPPAPLHPPLPRFRRPVHAPQRILRVFGLGSSPSRSPWASNATEMGNIFSQFFQSKRDESGSLKEYKDLVEHSAATGDAFAKAGVVCRKRFSPVISDLRSLIQRQDGWDSSSFSARKVEDARMVALESVPVNKASVLVKECPTYKELYQETKKYDPTLNDLEFKAKLAEQKISLLRAEKSLKAEPKAKDDLGEPFYPLKIEEEEEVARAFSKGNSREILVAHEPSNIEITREVLQCLRPGTWLNDEVINLYLELLKERERREPKRFLKCHFMNTFFYNKLTSGRNGYDFRAVRRWTTQRKLGYTLVECDKVFVPVHKDIHWCLAVIDIKDETFQYLDSLGGVDAKLLKVLERYLMEEARDKGAKEINTTLWKKESVADLPLQMNGWDCGMFMLKYIDFYSRGVSLCFSQSHMSYFRRRTAKEILKLRAE